MWPKDTGHQETSDIDQFPQAKKGYITDDIDTKSEGSMSEGTLYNDDESDLGNTGGDSAPGNLEDREQMSFAFVVL